MVAEHHLAIVKVAPPAPAMTTLRGPVISSPLSASAEGVDCRLATDSGVLGRFLDLPSGELVHMATDAPPHAAFPALRLVNRRRLGPGERLGVLIWVKASGGP
jgi:hypothetical protein